MSACWALSVAVFISSALRPRWATWIETLLPRRVAQPLLELGGVVGHRRHEHLPRDVGGRGVAVGALQHLIDEIAAGDVELLLDRRGAHTAHAAAADDEVLHGRGELVLGDAEEVGIRVGRRARARCC